MNKILLVILLGIIVSCTKDDSSGSYKSPLGSWQLVSILSDPGDGSGTFEDVDSDIMVTFLEDGTLTANGDLCTDNLEANSSVMGTYSLSDQTIDTPNCLTLSFEVNGNELIISIPCDEPCKSKFRKK